MYFQLALLVSALRPWSVPQIWAFVTKYPESVCDMELLYVGPIGCYPIFSSPSPISRIKSHNKNKFTAIASCVMISLLKYSWGQTILATIFGEQTISMGRKLF